jgi:hypothetical protein
VAGTESLACPAGKSSVSGIWELAVRQMISESAKHKRTRFLLFFIGKFKMNLIKGLARFGSYFYHAIVFLGSEIIEIVIDRINIHPVKLHLVMQMGCHRQTCVANISYYIAPGYFLTLTDVESVKMSIDCRISETMIDDDMVSEASLG